ncbi:MAG: folate-binding protein YgfZ [Gammaproteobacteria bacterium]|nr:folate-binding protein YgfZ [Gammaproteobacteria bacterium]
MNPETFRLLTHAAVSCPLDLAVIRVEGPDARDFLHGQCTSHLKRLGPQDAVRTAWCTPQGRVSFLFWLVPTATGYHLLLPASEATRCVQRLRMFVLRAKVEVEDISATCQAHGLNFPATLSAQTESLSLPAEAWRTTRISPSLVAVRMESAPRFLLIGEPAETAKWLARHEIATVDPETWRYLDIRHGHVEIAGGYANAFLPQQLNLDFQDTLAFDKGCYPGQEIIARLKYRGEVKSRLLVGTSGSEILAGEKFAASPQAPTGGQVLASVRDPGGTTHLLAVVDLGALATGLVTADSPARTVRFERTPTWQD